MLSVCNLHEDLFQIHYFNVTHARDTIPLSDWIWTMWGLNWLIKTASRNPIYCIWPSLLYHLNNKLLINASLHNWDALEADCQRRAFSWKTCHVWSRSAGVVRSGISFRLGSNVSNEKDLCYMCINHDQWKRILRPKTSYHIHCWEDAANIFPDIIYLAIDINTIMSSTIPYIIDKYPEYK